MTDVSSQTDADLLRRIAGRDGHAFTELFARYASRVKAFVMRAGPAAEDADEIAQEVLVTIWHKAHLFDPRKSAASTWIFTIARNRRIDHARRGARPEPDPDDPLFVPDPEPGGLEALSAQQLAAGIGAGLRTLPPAQREILRLVYYEGLTQSEAACQLDLPLGTVKSRIRLAFQHLRETLGGDYADMLRDD